MDINDPRILLNQFASRRHRRAVARQFRAQCEAHEGWSTKVKVVTVERVPYPEQPSDDFLERLQRKLSKHPTYFDSVTWENGVLIARRNTS